VWCLAHLNADVCVTGVCLEWWTTGGGVCVKTLCSFRKKLTPEQLHLLLAKAHAGSPLYLMTCCEELRLQAQCVVVCGDGLGRGCIRLGCLVHCLVVGRCLRCAVKARVTSVEL